MRVSLIDKLSRRRCRHYERSCFADRKPLPSAAQFLVGGHNWGDVFEFVSPRKLAMSRNRIIILLVLFTLSGVGGCAGGGPMMTGKVQSLEQQQTVACAAQRRTQDPRRVARSQQSRTRNACWPKSGSKSGSSKIKSVAVRDQLSTASTQLAQGPQRRRFVHQEDRKRSKPR